MRRFLDKVNQDGPNGCWEWTAARTAKGYGCFRFGSRGSARAHRVAYELFVGPIPDGLLVCHHCDNPSCVNPDHLYVGTQKQNRQDAVLRNRTARGAENGMYTHPETRQCLTDNANSKLTSEQYAELFELRGQSWGIHRLGKRFGITKQSVASLLRTHPDKVPEGART
jgi:hypothetical protein